MDSTLRLLESLKTERGVRKRESIIPVSSPAPVVDVDRDFFTPISSPSLPDKPLLPEPLLRFQYLYRIALVGGLSAEACEQVIEAIHEAADILLGVLKGKIWQGELPGRMAELETLEQTWMDNLPVGEDPFQDEEKN